MSEREFWIWPQHDAVRPVGTMLVMTPANGAEPIHVIEKSAYDQLKGQLDSKRGAMTYEIKRLMKECDRLNAEIDKLENSICMTCDIWAGEADRLAETLALIADTRFSDKNHAWISGFAIGRAMKSLELYEQFKQQRNK